MLVPEEIYGIFCEPFKKIQNTKYKFENKKSEVCQLFAWRLNFALQLPTSQMRTISNLQIQLCYCAIVTL
jgi:hypothetical protein